jgi:L-ascorbate metabolism protein UlaG (beta-lactamase superfamily)
MQGFTGGRQMKPEDVYETDTFETFAGPLKLTFLGHGSLMMEFGGRIYHVDPYGKVADYSTLPKADVILITHEHHDHFDKDALGAIRASHTELIYTPACAPQISGGMVMKNGDVRMIDGVRVEAMPAYNLVHKRPSGQPFHPKGMGNGYVLAFGGKRLYIAGDTENIPEMGDIGPVDVAFLPMNLPYTMTPKMVAQAAEMIRPTILYPYHYGDTDVSELLSLMEKVAGVEVRIRDMR